MVLQGEFREKWAILIGAHNYTNGIGKLNFCANDVKDLAGVLVDVLEFKPENVLQFRDLTNAESVERDRLRTLGLGLEPPAFFPPTSDAIWHQLGRLRDEKPIPRDGLLLFFFAGHGLIGNQDQYLLPVGASRFNLAKTALGLTDIAKELNAMECNNIVMMLDCCREETGARGEDEAGARAFIDSVDAALQEAMKARGIVTFFSCSEGTRAYEIETLSHGAFTHCLLEAINSGDCETIRQMDTYLKNQLPLLTQKYEKPLQNPRCSPTDTAKLELAVFRGKARIEPYEDLCAAIWEARNLDGMEEKVCLDLDSVSRMGRVKDEKKYLLDLTGAIRAHDTDKVKMLVRVAKARFADGVIFTRPALAENLSAAVASAPSL